MRYYYNDDPIFDGTKVIVSLYEDRLKGNLDKNFTKKIKFDDIEESNLTILSKTSYENLYKLSVIHSDGLILSPKIKKDFSDVLNGLDIPLLECSNDSEDYKEKYKNFYNSFLNDK